MKSKRELVLSSHSILLTNRGFKVFSSDFFVDALSFISLFTIAVFTVFQNLSFLFYFLFAYVAAALFYLYYKLNVGYIYYLSFFYQLTLYLLITPIGFLNWFTISFSLVVYFVFSLRGNVFYKFRFPPGLFLSLLSVALGLILGRMNIINLNVFAATSEMPFSFFPIVTGMYMNPFISFGNSFAPTFFSILESLDLYLLMLVGFLFLRQENFILDVILISVMAFIFSYFYRYDLLICKNKIINFTSLWYILFSAPGRSHHLSSFLSLIVALGTLVTSWFLIQANLVFPPILFIIIFFILYGIIFYLVTESILAKNLLYRYIVRK
jgi:hypothetical protein